MEWLVLTSVQLLVIQLHHLHRNIATSQVSWPWRGLASPPPPSLMKGRTSEKMLWLSRTIHSGTGGTMIATSLACPNVQSSAEYASSALDGCLFSVWVRISCTQQCGLIDSRFEDLMVIRCKTKDDGVKDIYMHFKCILHMDIDGLQ